MAAVALPPIQQPPPAIAVTIDAVAIDRPIELLANEQLVTATPFLPWTTAPAGAAGAPAAVRLSQFRAVRAFVRRCTLGQDAGDFAAFQQVECMMFGLNAAFWSRLLTVLRDARLFDQGPFLTWPQFLQCYRQLDVSTLDLSIHQADLEMGESWETPAVPVNLAPQGRGRGRGQAAPPALPPAPIPAVPGPADLEFLSLVTLDQNIAAIAKMSLWACGRTSSATWAPVLLAVLVSRLSRQFVPTPCC